MIINGQTELTHNVAVCPNFPFVHFISLSSSLHLFAFLSVFFFSKKKYVTPFSLFPFSLHFRHLRLSLK